MTKQEYQEALIDLDKHINLLKDNKKEVARKYIEANAKFKIGDKVIVVTKNKRIPGIVKAIEVDYVGKIQYVCKKIKKDGTASSFDTHYPFLDVIIEPWQDTQ